MTDLRVIGIDPGPTPGIAVIEFELVGTAHAALRRVEVIQCTHGIVGEIFGRLLDGRGWTPLVQIERFVVRGRATADQSLTVNQVSLLVDQAESRQVNAAVRSASHVKPWATDRRLEAAGLLEACKGMRHARDAARHALFAAVHDGAIPDPLSKDWNR